MKDLRARCTAIFSVFFFFSSFFVVARNPLTLNPCVSKLKKYILRIFFLKYAQKGMERTMEQNLKETGFFFT